MLEDLNDIRHYVEHSIEVKTAILNNEKFLLKIFDTAQLIIAHLRKGKKILIAGNGGSAGDAMHMSTELVSRFYLNRPALPCIALSADNCAITAISNDFNFENVFSRQIEALGRENDIFLAISTSGNSKNILNAIDTAREKRLKTIFLTSETANLSYLRSVDMALCVPSSDTPLIQEAHLMIEHLICYEVEKEFQK